MAASGEQDLYDNADAKIRYEAYRCEFMRYEAYRWEDLSLPDVIPAIQRKPVNISTHNFTTSIFEHQRVQSINLLCSRLQAAAVAHGESLPIPEIVAIGGQSDGKSSLLEAFLGFRFNIR